LNNPNNYNQEDMKNIRNHILLEEWGWKQSHRTWQWGQHSLGPPNDSGGKSLSDARRSLESRKEVSTRTDSYRELTLPWELNIHMNIFYFQFFICHHVRTTHSFI
jgi:hypothetical protein